MRYTILLFIGVFLILPPVLSQNARNSFVDEDGVLRWDTDSTEIFGFGINYSVPFAHAYRMANRLGVSHEEAIKQDIYHFARLDLDLYRVHVWDTEISDSVGNLLENEHLRLFDFSINEMKKRGMRFVITPIAFWGNGWPEPDENTPGFSNKYGKDACLTHPDAIEAQANYLEQFLNHVNPYTGIAYKDDPDVIAFEISNEPHHSGSKDEVNAYINKMVGSMRNTGTRKPVFYNMSHSIHLADAYMEADVQGGTFQWYPAGLVANHALKGNFLPHVNDYLIPFADHPGFQDKAKIVYEFDPADVAGNYMYPAMARSFREAGIQLATHFAYDAMFLAPYNTNYGTHFMNLAYAPQKAISLKIASAVFHDIPLNADFGDFPENNTFGNFKVSYQNDLVELVGEERFFYSN
ncbi:MAG TPA: cellulase family glycosylhydrolase, partial [Bacteroidales bacterium]|nr:cellulase family glycosylhydrolase [Bacteroidales bacterium]